jgi:pyruvate dehydrogenase E2 component (dihydrolipoamide acetyltransferase)
LALLILLPKTLSAQSLSDTKPMEKVEQVDNRAGSNRLIGDRYEALDPAERWFRDGLQLCDAPGFMVTAEVDMTQAQALVQQWRTTGIKVTYTHVIVRAVAMTLQQHPELHQLVVGNRRLYPQQVDIGLSVAGQTFVAPVMVLPDAGNKDLAAIAQEVITRSPEIKAKEAEELAVLRQWGGIIPFSWLRQAILRLLTRRISFKRQVAGTFQVTCLPEVDALVPFMFNTTAVLGVGRVSDRVVAVNGEPVVRPTAILSCCVDHKVWDGARAAQFMTTLRHILEAGKLESAT